MTLRAGAVAQVIQPAAQHQHAVLLGGVAEREVIRHDRRAGPIGHPPSAAAGRLRGLGLTAAARGLLRWRRLREVGGLLRNTGRVHGLGDHFEDPRARNIGPQCLVEGGHEGLRLARPAEIGDRDRRPLAFGDGADVDGGLLREQENCSAEDCGNEKPGRVETAAAGHPGCTI